MPRLSSRPKPPAIQLTLDFATPTQAERDAANSCMLSYAFGDELDQVYRRLVARPCRCPSCDSTPVNMSIDNNLRSESFGIGTRYTYNHEPIIELACHCGQHWNLPQGWQIVVRDRYDIPDTNEILLIEGHGSMFYARPPMAEPQWQIANDCGDTFTNAAIGAEPAYGLLVRMQDGFAPRIENQMYRATFSTI